MATLDHKQLKDDAVVSVPVREAPSTPWRVATDPFAKATPVHDLSTLVGGLPDPRDAEAILRDLARCRTGRAR
jgi:hypothetical protein